MTTVAATKAAPLHSAIADKIRDIEKSPKQRENAVSKLARETVENRVRRRFFEDVYTLQFSADQLQSRPFLNIGPGSFRHRYWRTADKGYGDTNETWTKMRRGKPQPKIDYVWDIYEGRPFPEDTGSFDVIYCSHVIEHLFPEDAGFLLREMRRLLRPGGHLRLVCPDAELMMRAYQAEDWAFFLHYLIAKTQRVTRPLARYTPTEARTACAAFLVEWVSLMTHPQNPKCLRRRDCAAYLASFPSLKDAFDAAGADSSRSLNMQIGGHVNWFDAGKLTDCLDRAGFTQIKRSGYLQSELAFLRDPLLFDRTDPEMSLFLEAR